MRSNSVPVFQYIDARHVGQLRLSTGAPSCWSNLDLAKAAAFIASLVLIACGYFIGIKKSVLTPVQVIPFLGFLSDSRKQAFILPEEKKQQFATLRDHLISLNKVPVKSLQKVAGKAVLFALAVPAAKLFCREINHNIGKGLRSAGPVRMSNSLKNELESWKFLDSWDGFLPWRKERHLEVKITSDAANSGWGGIISLPDGPKYTRDYWCPEDADSPGGIAVKEAKALHQTLSTFAKEVFNSRVDAYVDNSNLIDFWNNEGGRNIPLTNVIKCLFDLSLKLNILLNLRYVPSMSNSADIPSRAYSDLDCALSHDAWRLIDSFFGPHTFDLMALPSNVKKAQNGCNLKFFSPLPFKDSSGINVFAQDLLPVENYYVFPPFILIGALFKFLGSHQINVTLVVPDISPRQYWWPLLNASSTRPLKIGSRKQHNLILFPPNTKQNWHSRPLQWDLYAFRFCF